MHKILSIHNGMDPNDSNYILQCSYTDCRNSGSLNLPENSWLAQACNGITLLVNSHSCLIKGWQHSWTSFKHTQSITFPLIPSSIVTCCGLDGRVSNAGGGKIFRIRPDRPWCPPSLLHNGYQVSYLVVKWLRNGIYHLPLPSAKFKERYSYTSTLPLSLHDLFYSKCHIYLYHYGMFPLQ
jgi:hypothetical protein